MNKEFDKISQRTLEILENDCSISKKQIALMLDKEEGEIADIIAGLEKSKTIVGYKAIVDWEKTGKETVTALIELKISPQKDRGFDKIAEKIYNFPEVKAAYLMSGGFDLALIIRGRTIREVAAFVAEKLAVMDNIVSTATHFVLRRYKEKDFLYSFDEKEDKRSNIF